MLQWRLEASNDMVNWTLLDERVHSPNDRKAMLTLCQTGATSSWGIDPLICQKLGIEDGFHTFRIVQTGVNSSGSYNLGLGGFEIYGHPTNTYAWQF